MPNWTSTQGDATTSSTEDLPTSSTSSGTENSRFLPEPGPLLSGPAALLREYLPLLLGQISQLNSQLAQLRKEIVDELELMRVASRGPR